jgi:hypothetical protein
MMSNEIACRTKDMEALHKQLGELESTFRLNETLLAQKEEEIQQLTKLIQEKEQ